MKPKFMVQGRDLRGKWGADYWMDSKDDAYAFAQKYSNDRGVRVRVCEWSLKKRVYKYFDPSGAD